LGGNCQFPKEKGNKSSKNRDITSQSYAMQNERKKNAATVKTVRKESVDFKGS